MTMGTISDTSRSPDNGATGDMPPDHAVLDPLTMRARTINQVSLLDKLYRGATSSLELLPDLLVIGTQRGGTSALYQYLRTHRFIKPATTSDTHFFEKKYHKGLTWYRGHFPTRIERS